MKSRRVVKSERSPRQVNHPDPLTPRNNADVRADLKLVLIEWLDAHSGRGWQTMEQLENVAEPL